MSDQKTIRTVDRGIYVRSLFSNNETNYPDVEFICDDGRVKAHRLVLIAISPLFLGQLMDDQVIGETTLITLPGMTTKIMEYLLQLAYTGKTTFPSESKMEMAVWLSKLKFIGIQVGEPEGYGENLTYEIVGTNIDQPSAHNHGSTEPNNSNMMLEDEPEPEDQVASHSQRLYDQVWKRLEERLFKEINEIKKQHLEAVSLAKKEIKLEYTLQMITIRKMSQELGRLTDIFEGLNFIRNNSLGVQDQEPENIPGPNGLEIFEQPASVPPDFDFEEPDYMDADAGNEEIGSGSIDPVELDVPDKEPNEVPVNSEIIEQPGSVPRDYDFEEPDYMDADAGNEEIDSGSINPVDLNSLSELDVQDKEPEEIRDELGNIESPGSVPPETDEDDKDDDEKGEETDKNQSPEDQLSTGHRPQTNVKKPRLQQRAQCEECGKVFYSITDLKRNWNSIHASPSKKVFHICESCGKQFSDPSTLCKHIKWHSGIKPFSCPTCNKRFLHRRQLQSHEKVHVADVDIGNEEIGSDSVESKPTCPICKKRFSRRESLRDHEKLHNPNREKEYKCPEPTCGKLFSHSQSLSRHIKTHPGLKQRWSSSTRTRRHKKPQSKCKDCGKEFKRRSSLKLHWNSVHASPSEKILKKCPRCPKTFADPNSLRKHIQMHNGVKPHSCPICKKRFLHGQQLRSHQELHNPNREKKYKCQTCGNKFSHSQSLLKHIKKTHNGPKQRWSCSTCDVGKVLEVRNS